MWVFGWNGCVLGLNGWVLNCNGWDWAGMGGYLEMGLEIGGYWAGMGGYWAGMDRYWEVGLEWMCFKSNQSLLFISIQSIKI